MNTMKISENIQLGDNHPVWVVAEIGLCHNGDMTLAKDMIKQSAECGVDAVKFQKRDVDNLAIASVLDAPDSRFPAFGNTYREVRHHIEFSLEQMSELQRFSRDIGIPFFSSVFDVKSAEQMASLEIPLIKVASHCVSHRPLIDCLCALGIPVLMSTGMATLEEIDETVELFDRANVPLGLYHCVSDYPHTYETANLSMIPFLGQRYNLPVGYSSHELDNDSAFLSVALGASTIEKHVTTDRTQEGFDHKIAQDMNGLKDLVEGVRRAETALGNPEKSVSEKEQITRNKYHWSVVSKTPIHAGQQITAEMITVKNPMGGVPSREFHSVVGSIAKNAIAEDHQITWDMLEKQ